MSFLETVEKARAFLERNERVSLRALQREFNLDGGALDAMGLHREESYAENAGHQPVTSTFAP